MTDIRSLHPSKMLNDIRRKISNRYVITQLSISFLKNKFASLSTMIKDNVNILIMETKIDSPFATAQFHRDGYAICKRDRSKNGGVWLLYVRDNVLATLLKVDARFEALYVDLSKREKTSLLCYIMLYYTI